MGKITITLKSKKGDIVTDVHDGSGSTAVLMFREKIAVRDKKKDLEVTMVESSPAKDTEDTTSRQEVK